MTTILDTTVPIKPRSKGGRLSAPTTAAETRQWIARAVQQSNPAKLAPLWRLLKSFEREDEAHREDARLKVQEETNRIKQGELELKRATRMHVYNNAPIAVQNLKRSNEALRAQVKKLEAELDMNLLPAERRNNG